MFWSQKHMLPCFSLKDQDSFSLMIQLPNIPLHSWTWMSYKPQAQLVYNKALISPFPIKCPLFPSLFLILFKETNVQSGQSTLEKHF